MEQFEVSGVMLAARACRFGPWRCGMGCTGGRCVKHWRMRVRRRAGARRGTRPVLGAYEATVRGWLAADRDVPRKQRHTARRIWQRLVEEEGARVGQSSVRSLVASIRAETGSGQSVVTVPQTHPVGAEAEVDFGEFVAVIAGELMKVWMFVMRLSHSGRAVHVAYANQAQESFLDGHVRAFTAFGGVPTGMIRYDNLTPAVVRVLLGRDRWQNPRFVALRSHYGYESFFCLPGLAGAHEKGGVEGEIGRFRRRHLTPVPHVGSLAALNAALTAADARDDARRIAARTETVGGGVRAGAGSTEPVARQRLRRLPDVVVPGRHQGPDLCAAVLLLRPGPAGRAAGQRPARRGPGRGPATGPRSRRIPGRCTRAARTWSWTTTWRC